MRGTKHRENRRKDIPDSWIFGVAVDLIGDGRVTLGVENGMALLANRVRIPQSLRMYVQDNYVEYIQGLPS